MPTTSPQWDASNEAIALGEQTLTIDPLVPLAHQELGWAFEGARRDDDALRMYRKTLELDPGMRTAWSESARIKLERGLAAEANRDIDELAKLARSGEAPTRLGILGYLFGRAGRRNDALHTLGMLRSRGRTEYVPASAIGLVYLGLGRCSDALNELERSLGGTSTSCGSRCTECMTISAENPDSSVSCGR